MGAVAEGGKDGAVVDLGTEAFEGFAFEPFAEEFGDAAGTVAVGGGQFGVNGKVEVDAAAARGDVGRGGVVTVRTADAFHAAGVEVEFEGYGLAAVSVTGVADVQASFGRFREDDVEKALNGVAGEAEDLAAFVGKLDGFGVEKGVDGFGKSHAMAGEVLRRFSIRPFELHHAIIDALTGCRAKC